ncbi:MAG TPA: lysyl oxidase family protein [Mycobacteriales bacterium]|nr:lysyl oxidase family protein [Mycobacteriales bacterium]
MRGWARVGATAAVGTALAVLPTASQAVGSAPGIRLMTVVGHSTAVRFEGDPFVYLQPGVYAAATNGPFQLDARRGADGTVAVSYQGTVLRTPQPVQMENGLPAFFAITVKNARGRSVASVQSDFCPGGWYGQSRVDGSGPDNPTYPYYCGSSLTRATVWGIDKGWASPLALGFDGTRVADGDYTATISIASTYVRQLGLDPAVSSATFALTVRTEQWGGCPPDVPCRTAARTSSPQEAGPLGVTRAESSGTTGLSGAGQLPNLAALPAHSLFTETDGAGHDYLDFGATMWNAGPGPLVVEGFRQAATDVMPATQFLYDGSSPAGSASAGQFEYDRREGHDHWHYEDAAQYDLLDGTGNRVLLSGKQSFCLAPTDPIDLTLPGAEWHPDRQRLWSSCFGEDAIWLREVMPAGWGDTYFQGVAGQSFDITSLPNATYKLRVTTNPANRILETRYDDNSAVISLTLGGSPGARTVTSSALTR